MAYFPNIEPYHSFFLKVSGIHTLYVEECGNPKGKPIVFLHGGPGGGIQPNHRQYFSPDKWRIILFSQRGCGQSTPFGEIVENTTWDLVEDIEKIRKHLQIDKWAVFGGSWGSTLALAYAQTHPEKVEGLILRGIFTLRDEELQWFYQKGANYIYPDAFEEYEQHIPENEREDFIQAYYKRLTSDNENIRNEAARIWTLWEGKTSRLIPTQDFVSQFEESSFAYAFARIECHYFINKGFFTHPEQLLHNIFKIKHIPASIVQGRYDIPCPMKTAWELHKAWPSARFHIVQDAGHAGSESGILSLLISETERLYDLL